MDKGINPAALSALLKGDLKNAMVAQTPGGIEAQEAQGQKDMVESQVFPKKHNGCVKEDFEKMGVVYGEDKDDIFVNVTLPKGWQIKPTDHSMWSEILNEKGKVIANIFYKAAFYDRHAYISLQK